MKQSIQFHHKIYTHSNCKTSLVFQIVQIAVPAQPPIKKPLKTLPEVLEELKTMIPTLENPSDMFSEMTSVDTVIFQANFKLNYLPTSMGMDNV
jgi:hypothetical protein